MMTRKNIRVMTAIAIIGICGFSAVRGWAICYFSLATANISSAQRAEILNTWADAPDVASAALRVELSTKIDSSDVKAAENRRQALVSMLSIKPLSSVDWLSLSAVQFVTDQPMERVTGSLELSMMTGPNEGYLMRDRGIFGLSLWEHLSPDLKNRVAWDLAAGIEAETRKIHDVLSTKPAWVRSELRVSLLGIGLSPQDIDRRLGR